MHTGGDIAFLNGVLKVLLAETAVDREFVRDHTTGFDELAARSSRRSRSTDLEAASGATARRHGAVRRGCYGAAESAVLIWSMGITQHAHGVDNVTAIVNLALARGNVGRTGAGLMPIRGHSGVQGGVGDGRVRDRVPRRRHRSTRATPPRSPRQYGFPIGVAPGS